MIFKFLKEPVEKNNIFEFFFLKKRRRKLLTKKKEKVQISYLFTKWAHSCLEFLKEYEILYQWLNMASLTSTMLEQVCMKVGACPLLLWNPADRKSSKVGTYGLNKVV